MVIDKYQKRKKISVRSHVENKVEDDKVDGKQMAGDKITAPRFFDVNKFRNNIYSLYTAHSPISDTKTLQLPSDEGRNPKIMTTWSPLPTIPHIPKWPANVSQRRP